VRVPPPAPQRASTPLRDRAAAVRAAREAARSVVVRAREVPLRLAARGARRRLPASAAFACVSVLALPLLPSPVGPRVTADPRVLDAVRDLTGRTPPCSPVERTPRGAIARARCEIRSRAVAYTLFPSRRDMTAYVDARVRHASLVDGTHTQCPSRTPVGWTGTRPRRGGDVTLGRRGRRASITWTYRKRLLVAETSAPADALPRLCTRWRRFA